MIKPKKELGQNFLTNQGEIKKIVSAADIQPHETIIEIGAGLGALTKQILTKLQGSGKLYAIEFDPRMVEHLTTEFSQYNNLELVHANVLDWLPDLNLENRSEVTGDFKIIGSLPYYITSPILHKIVKLNHLPAVCALLVQKEVGEKISAQPPEASYMSVFIQTFFKVEYVGTISKKSFTPVPQVDGGIIKLTKRPNIKTFLETEKQKSKYSRFLHKGFQSPRKMINKVFTSEELALADLNPKLRPQNIDVEKWLEMYEKFTLQ